MLQNLPEIVKKTRACVNVRSNDGQSFKWAVLSALHPQHNGQRLRPYKKFEHKLNFSGITFPVEPSQVARFEKQNDISIDIYILRNEKISLLHKSVEKNPKHIDLLLIRTLKDFHYVWIKKLSWLLKSFTVLSESFQEKNRVTQSRNSSEIMQRFRSSILQKTKKLQPEEPQETSRIDFHSDKFKQPKELDSYSKKEDVSTQTTFDVADTVKLQKMELKESVINSQQIFDTSQRAKDSRSRIENQNFSNEGSDDNFVRRPFLNHNYISSTDDVPSTDDEIDYENWKDPNKLVDRLRLLIEQ